MVNPLKEEEGNKRVCSGFSCCFPPLRNSVVLPFKRYGAISTVSPKYITVTASVVLLSQLFQPTACGLCVQQQNSPTSS
jgi:hypothetical protein